MTLEGGEAMKVKLRLLAHQFPLEVRRAANVVIDRKLAITQERVPVKTGKLKKTGRKMVSLSKVGGAPNVSASIVYGSLEVLYARRVHEDLLAKHKVGQAKYVESVILESVSTAGSELANEISLQRAM